MNPKKVIIFDAGTLISISTNGLFHEFVKLKKAFDGKFIITPQVKKEIIEKPLKVKRFELEAMKFKNLLKHKIIELPSSINITSSEISKKTKEMKEIANNLFISKKGGNIKVISDGETSCLALSSILKERGVENLIAMDERTARVLVEEPSNLKELLEKKMHTKIKLNKKNFQKFKGFKIIRSAELMYLAWKKGLVDLEDGNVLDALLYALKYKGCAISRDEIDKIKKIN